MSPGPWLWVLDALVADLSTPTQLLQALATKVLSRAPLPGEHDPALLTVRHLLRYLLEVEVVDTYVASALCQLKDIVLALSDYFGNIAERPDGLVPPDQLLVEVRVAGVRIRAGGRWLRNARSGLPGLDPCPGPLAKGSSDNGRTNRCRTSVPNPCFSLGWNTRSWRPPGSTALRCPPSLPLCCPSPQVRTQVVCSELALRLAKGHAQSAPEQVMQAVACSLAWDEEDQRLWQTRCGVGRRRGVAAQA